MPTLDEFNEFPEYRLTLNWHQSRTPTEDLVDKIGQALQLARKMISDALVQIPSVIEDSREVEFDEPEYKGHHPVAVQAAKYHLNATKWGNTYRNYVLDVITKTASGLNAPVTLSDVLSYSTVNLYKVYRDKQTIDQARYVLGGSSREAHEVNPKTGQLVEMEGYVRHKRKVREALKQKQMKLPPALQEPDRVRDMYGSMHIEFSLAEIYPLQQLARVILHEATHKFAHTVDEAYTEDSSYRGLDAGKKTRNADSYAYFVLSIHANKLIKNKKECFGVFPQYGSSELEHAADKAVHGGGS
jgi:hypothetical protein